MLNLHFCTEPLQRGRRVLMLQVLPKHRLAVELCGDVVRRRERRNAICSYMFQEAFQKLCQ